MTLAAVKTFTLRVGSGANYLIFTFKGDSYIRYVRPSILDIDLVTSLLHVSVAS